MRYFISIILFLLIPNLSYADDRLVVKKSNRKFKISPVILLSPIARFDARSKSFDIGIEKAIGININYTINYNIGLFNWSLKELGVSYTFSQQGFSTKPIENYVSLNFYSSLNVVDSDIPLDLVIYPFGIQNRITDRNADFFFMIPFSIKLEDYYIPVGVALEYGYLFSKLNVIFDGKGSEIVSSSFSMGVKI